MEMGKQREKTLCQAYMKIGVVVSCYWFVSIALVFVNKYLLSSSDLKLDAPFTVTWFQCLVSVILCIALRSVSLIDISLGKDVWFVAKQVAPLSLIFVGMIAFNNLCLKHVGVSFYYIGRSLTTVFNVLLSYIILRQKTSAAAITCCCIIVLGFMLGVDQENVAGSLSVTGVTFGVLASAFVALYSIFIKKVLNHTQNNAIALTFYNNLNATVLFLPLILLNREYEEIVSFRGLSDVNFWILMVVGGIFGFAIGFLISLQVQVTSPLTNNISGTAKACVQTVIATAWYEETKPIFWWVSNGIVLLGSAAYTRVRQIEMHKEHVSKIPTEENPSHPA